MRALALSFVLALARAEGEAGADGAAPSTVLTADNFDKLVSPDEPWLVEFWAPWCSHCKKLEPVWRRAAEQLSGGLRFGTVDVTVHKALAKRFDIRGYPTVKHMHRGRARTYEGEKSVLGFAEYAARMAAPAARAFGSVAELRTWLGPLGRAFVLAGPSAALADARLASAFATLADERHDALTFATIGASAAPAELLSIGRGGGSSGSAPAPPATLIGVLDGEWFDPFEPPAASDASALADALLTWANAREWPSVVGISSANFHRLRKRANVHLALALIDPADADGARAQRAQLPAHALAHRAAFQFGWADATELADYWRSEYGVERSALPTLLVLAARGAAGTSASDDHHWRAHNGTAPLARADEQAAFLAEIAAGALRPERSGAPFSLLGVLRTAWLGVRSFATAQPTVFAACVALNIAFVASLAWGGGGGGGGGRGARAKRE
ncbi:hypothetical protein KFE25_010336 [Diacronema lutheri]|uniref:Thioredoxin domain-containing protein n=1 Tax=Diacronema lutheri TaxID=2081491 RepID=A0A8J5XBN5_DIALT|nr:hypothetical protein KFE25_010336 [Diacronema lutheri]